MQREDEGGAGAAIERQVGMGEPVVGVDDVGLLLADHAAQIANCERVRTGRRVAALLVDRHAGDAVHGALEQMQLDPVLALRRLAGRLAQRRDPDLCPRRTSSALRSSTIRSSPPTTGEKDCASIRIRIDLPGSSQRQRYETQ